MIYLVGFLVMFVRVFIKGWQHKNVNGNHYKLAFLFSYLMAVMDA